MAAHKLQCVSGAPPVVSGPVSILIEQQQSDTVLPEAGIPLQAGERYYGIHVAPIPEGASVAKTLVSGLARVAFAIERYNRNWNTEKFGAPPQYVAGVTHWRLAQFARHAGFSASRLDRETFFTPVNQEVGWDEYARRVEGTYRKYSQLGQKAVPMAFGVAAQTTDAVIAQWHPHLLSEQQKVLFDPKIYLSYASR